jgi:hypothetical protein
MNKDSSTNYDSGDIIIARVLKEWIYTQELPGWVRSQVLIKASLSSGQSPNDLDLRVALQWLLSSVRILLSLLTSDESLIFTPSRDSYCWNPPHLSPCVVQTRVRDTFLLRAGILGAFG